MRRRAFTLIELLVVIAIISVLIGLLMPALSRSRQIGRATLCLSNLRAMCQAVQMYADNNEGKLPAAGLAHGGSVDEGNAWVNTMVKETGGSSVTRCPVDQSPYWNKPLEGTNQKRRLSYANNYYTVGTIEGKEEFNEMTRIKRPSATIYWAELAEEGGFAVADHVHPETWFLNPRIFAAREIQLERHIKRANYGMVDGHAEPQSFDDIYRIDTAHSSFPNIAWIHNKFDPAIAW
jgi:prepilin-type N-terminal cleavage/methylation domain-containing protein/prepilin-type processing-associated H-X9-DG protein